MESLTFVTESELKLLKQFQEEIKDLELSDEMSEDKNLVRWLRARNYKLKDAEVMIRQHVKWREEVDIKMLGDKGNFLPSGWNQFYLAQLYGISAQGNPIHIISGKSWDIEKGFKAGIKEEIIKNAFSLIEKGWRICLKNSKGKNCIPQFISIYDLNGVSISQCSSPEAVNGLLNVARELDSNYPECLKRIFILNAPWIFQILWKLLCQILSEKTTSRIMFLGGKKEIWREEISKLLQLKEFPKKYGGEGDDDGMINHLI